uniref:Polyamine oxidase (EC) n=1 Tax=Ganoderma boninense TaxID=34458 RepID=A0A5K1K1V7_9APHY|nr:Polyamine oxidase (EC [Ganoderma boninense]
MYAVVLTTVYSELVAQKDLFTFRRRVLSRDHRVLSIALLFFGGFSGRAILQSASAAAALGVGAAVRLVITLWWLFVPGKEQGKPRGQGRSFSEASTECG